MGSVKAGGPTKADLLLVSLGDGEMVVKDFARKPWWVRLLGWIQIRRECRAYRWIGAAAGVPVLVGKVDGLALALEKVEGVQLAFAPNRFTDGEILIGRLRALLDRLHAVGIVHNDLRGRENVLLRPDGEVVILDLAGAVCLRPGSLAHRLLFRWLVKTDEAAFLKWKALLTPGRFTPAEEEFLRRFGFWRRLWPFNRKRPVGRGESS